MKIHEYQAKALLREFGVPVPAGDVATTPVEARTVAARLGGKVVVKAQVHAGGRGKAGGIKLADDAEGAQRAAQQILGMKLKTPQTPPDGILVRSVLVEEASGVDRELYLSMTLDRARATHVVMASQAGGMDIEEVAARTPERIGREWAHPALGIQDFQARRLAYGLGLAGEQFKQAVGLIRSLFTLYLARDCSLVEINPLVVTKDGRVLALDAKIVIDDNELFWRPDLGVLRDDSAEEPSEAAARRANLSFIKLDGNVGCVVNGAGLAMATMDLVKYYGGEPANFLDIGGSSSPEKVINALKIITADPHVKAILFNIFGGITRTDDVANGIVAATRQFKVGVPIVIRLTGTNEVEAIRILEAVGMRALSDMDEAVKQVVELARAAA